MTIKEIQKILKRKCVIFHTGGKKPTNELLESWIGSVRWKLPDEDWPVDTAGEKMVPVATIFLKGLPFCPPQLKGIELITVFMRNKLFDDFTRKDLAKQFEIRTYRSLDQLVACKYDSDFIKPFPLTPELIKDDFPVWDDGGIPSDIEDIILEMQDEDDIEYYEEICTNLYSSHKVGGHPAFCQSGYWFGDDYPFVMQIASDEKARLNIVDNGKFYFYYNSKNDDWKVYCDFY